MSPLSIIAFSILLVLLINAVALISARRKRRLSQARLELVQVVTEAEALMLSGKFCHGETCHDHLYKIIFQSQMERLRVPFRSLFRLPSAAERNFIESVEAELSEKDAVAKELFKKFLVAHRDEFHFTQPFVYCAFIAWVLLFTGSLIACLHAIKLLLNLVILALKGLKGWQEISRQVSKKSNQFMNHLSEWAIARSFNDDSFAKT